MNKTIFSILTIGLFLLSGLIVYPASSETVQTTSTGTTLYVGGSGPSNYSSIKSAIENASDGDTVFVYDDSSPYYEAVGISKSLRLIGENKYSTVIDSSGNENVITIHNKQNVEISQFTIQNGVPEGISIYESSNIIISDNIFKTNGNAISCFEGGYITITKNIISNNRANGIFFQSVDGKNFVNGNSISNNDKFALTIRHTEIKITNNNIINNGPLSPIIETYFISGLQYPHFWDGNYWNIPRILPKPIFGSKVGDISPFNIMIEWDRNPAKEPYDIGGVD